MTGLPVATAPEVRAHARRLVRQHPRELAVCLGLHALAAMVGLVAPQLLGRLVEEAGRGVDDITWVALTICSAVVVQSLLIRFATLASLTLGERVLARLREDVDSLTDHRGYP